MGDSDDEVCKIYCSASRRDLLSFIAFASHLSFCLSIINFIHVSVPCTRKTCMNYLYWWWSGMWISGCVMCNESSTLNSCMA